jgi:hypothetical protein
MIEDSSEYRAAAERIRKNAEAINDSGLRRQFLEVALQYERLAARVDRKGDRLPLGDPPAKP